MTLTSGPTRPPTRSVVRKAPPVSKEAAQLFKLACITVWGRAFVPGAAEALNVAERTVYRWARAEYPIPVSVFGEIADIADKKREQLAILAPRLREVGDPY